MSLAVLCRCAVQPCKFDQCHFADQQRLGQILKDAYNGTVRQSQTEQLAHAVAQQNIKVHIAFMIRSLYLSCILVQHAWQKLYTMFCSF